MKKTLFLLSILILIFSSCTNNEKPVIDEIPPVITGIKDILYTIGDPLPTLTEGIQANDETDGDLTDLVTLDVSDIDFENPGSYHVLVTVRDNAGNETRVSFKVIVSQETIAPEILGTVNLTFERGISNPNYLEGVSAIDNFDGDITASIVVDDSKVNLNEPGSYELTYSVSDNAGNFSSVTVSVTITLSSIEMIMEDVAYYKENQMINDDRINFFTRGGVYQSTIEWEVDHENILSSGIVLQLPKGSEEELITYSGTFKIGSTTYTENFTYLLKPFSGVELTFSRELDFENLTTEYEVEDGKLKLYYEEEGNVPYVNVEDFLNLIKGFIDPTYDIAFTLNETTLEIFYQYYDEEEDYTYDLIVILDSNEDTITTNDPGFYWAYVSSTETNFGRHINYVDMPDEHYIEGNDIVYELAKYRMDITIYENNLLIPFYIANQLFAGSSYYNVYYNYDALYGIYSLPDYGSDEFSTIRTSSKNNDPLPTDLVIHNFDMLNFSLDYFYGLKQYLNIDTFYEVTLTRKNKLLSHSVTTVDTAIRDLLLLDIDEPHTSYGYASYYNRPTYEGPPVNSIAVYGERFKEWYANGLQAVDEQIEAKWGREGISSNSWSASSTSRPMYWFLDEEKKSGVIILDSFRTRDLQETITYDKSIVDDIMGTNVVVIPEITYGDKFFFFKNNTHENMMMEILVKGVESSYLETYKNALLNLGYTLQLETTDEQTKMDGYYSKTINNINYMVQLGYDNIFNLFYVSIADEVPETYDDEWLISKDTTNLVKSDSAIYMEEVLENILSEAPNVENLMLDLSWNTGGNVGALYRVLGFITSEPFMVSRISGDTGSKSSSYVQIEGVPKYDSFNWAILISPLSFSAANSMATIFKYNNLGTVIGLQSGGGTSSITPILLPIGTAFTMSSNSLSAYRLGSGTVEDPYVYYDNEFGITPDIEIDINLIYDEVTLLSAFS